MAAVSKRIKQLLMLALTAAVVLVIGLFFAGKLLHNYWYEEFSLVDTEQVLNVPAGASLGRVIGDLHRREVLAEPRVAKLALRLFQPSLTVKAGEYRLPGRASRAAIFELLASGVSVHYSVTLVEGLTAREALQIVLAALPESPPAPAPALLAQADNLLGNLLLAPAREMMAGQSNPEGWFFPDTYHFVRGESATDILQRAHQRMLVVLQEEWPKRQPDLPFSRPYEALIMASIVEKETGKIEEREQIAGVFTRRLRKGMRLQTDPTVIYGVRDSYSGNLTRVHLRRDTPYNTYTRGGLPPTPIALPGRGAIRAALNPAQGDTFYFVAKGDGSHYFSKTLEEHQRAVRKYQVLQRRSNYRSAPPPKSTPAAANARNRAG